MRLKQKSRPTHKQTQSRPVRPQARYWDWIPARTEVNSLPPQVTAVLSSWTDFPATVLLSWEMVPALIWIAERSKPGRLRAYLQKFKKLLLQLLLFEVVKSARQLTKVSTQTSNRFLWLVEALLFWFLEYIEVVDWRTETEEKTLMQLSTSTAE